MSNVISYIILGIIFLAVIKLAIDMFNKIILLKNNVDKSFANIDVALKQRNDEVPNLVLVVKSAAKYENETLKQLTQIRADYLQSNKQNDKVKLANDMTQAIGKVIAVAENYPVLKANDSFLQLQKRLSEIENIIADRRELYNDSVNLYNIGIHEFPQLMVASVMGFKDREMLTFPAKELKNKSVKL